MQPSQSMTHRVEYFILAVILVGSVFLSYSIRAQPLNYAQELDEFDPYFNYRATDYLLTHGWSSYLEWHDDLSWYPNGRDVSATSQNMLHITAGISYKIFGGDMDLYDFVIYFPAVVGSLTVLLMFLLVRVLTNTRIGVMAGFFFAVSIPIIQRGTAGWFKSEPLGLFFGIAALYLIVSGIRMLQNDTNYRLYGLCKLSFAGVLMAFAISSWGGAIFFLLPIMIWILCFPGVFYKLNIPLTVVGFIGFAIPLFITGMSFDRANALLSGFASIGIVASVGFLVFHGLFNWRLKWNYNRTIMAYLGILLICASLLLYTNTIVIPTDSRYINVLVPFDITTSDLSRSVSEHQIPTFTHVFERTVFLMLFAPIGIFAIIRKKIPPDVGSFVMIVGVLGLYIGTTIVRLELFMSISMILFASIGIYYMFEKFSNTNRRRKKKSDKVMGHVIIIMLLVVTIFPTVVNWSLMMDRPPLIMTGGAYQGQNDSWIDVLEWIKTQTPEGSKIMAWWDYGYWIETKGERVTFMDNAAFNAGSIAEYASIFTDTPENGVQRLRELDADYMLVYFHGVQHTESQSFAQLGAGGDISKMPWIIKISGRNTSDYLDKNNILNKNFYANTLYGALIPFTPVGEIQESGSLNPIGYPWQRAGINPNTGQLYSYGWYQYEPTKYVEGTQLVYASNEFKNVPEDGMFSAILVYKIN